MSDSVFPHADSLVKDLTVTLQLLSWGWQLQC